jgi:hypothetical protein
MYFYGDDQNGAYASGDYKLVLGIDNKWGLWSQQVSCTCPKLTYTNTQIENQFWCACHPLTGYAPGMRGAVVPGRQLFSAEPNCL